MDQKHELRKRRHHRLRRKVSGTPQRPRLAVYRSLNHIYAQVIDDTVGRTLAAASTLDGGVRGVKGTGGNISAAQTVGRLIAERARAQGVERVVFDRGGYKYHGRVRSLADAAREGGLEF